MNIDQTSVLWIYMVSGWKVQPKGLCWFFWKVVLHSIFLVVTTVGAVWVGFIVLALLTFPIWQFFTDWHWQAWGSSMFLWSVIGVCLFIAHREWRYVTGDMERPVKVYREPGLLSQWMTAQHLKVCPRMEYPPK